MIDLTSNRIAYLMSTDEFTATKADLQKVNHDLHFLVKLTAGAVENLYRTSDGDKTFIRNCLTEMSNMHHLVPRYLKSEEITKDLAGGDQLLELENTVPEILNHIRLNRRLANAEAFIGASVFYRLVGAAARAGSISAQASYDRLQSYHLNKKKIGCPDRCGQSSPETGCSRKLIIHNRLRA